MFNRVEVRVVFRPLKFLHNKLVKLFIYENGFVHSHAGNEKNLPETVAKRLKAHSFENAFKSPLHWKQLNVALQRGVRMLWVI